MLCPSYKLLAPLLVFYIYMDYNIYVRIQNYPLLHKNATRNYKGWLDCELKPLCEVTVKAVLLDHINVYLFGPLVTLTDNIFKISKMEYVTPNLISGSHVAVAVLSAKCISNDKLSARRIGVVLFEVRTFLDGLDGHVARVRKHVKGERSEIGSTAHYVDGICDALGCAAVLIGAFMFLKTNRNEHKLLPTYRNKDTNTSDVWKKVLCFSVQLVFSSLAWNRYIGLYQDLLETQEDTDRQTEIFRSLFFYLVACLWRLVNVHSMMHFFLLAVFCDKLWTFLKNVQYLGFGLLIFVIGITEFHICAVRRFFLQKGLG